MSLKGKAAIVGIGETEFQKNSEKNQFQLASEASIKAIQDAGLTLKDIDGLLTLCPLSLNARTNLPLADYLGIRPSYCDEITAYGASSGYALKTAAEAIAAGTAKNVLVVGSDLNFLKHSSNEYHPIIDDYDMLLGLTGNSGYAMVASMHSHLYGTTDRQRAKIAADQRYNANHYENALFGKKPLSIEGVLESPMISSPFHLFECVSPCDGALAFVVTSSENAKSLTRTPVYIEGTGFYTGSTSITQSQMFKNGLVSPIKKASDDAFEMAGISTNNVDVCGFYDCYTIAVLMTIEDMGFCKKGEGGRFIEEHDLTFKGDFPLNTSGGQLSCGQPGDAGGMINIMEVVKQLMVRAGSRQIENLEVGVTNSNGGFFSTECTLVLRRG